MGAQPDTVKYTLRGTAGDAQVNEQLELGTEVLVVSRCVVSRIDEHLDATHLLVCNQRLEAKAAFVVGEGAFAQLKKLDGLTSAQVDQLSGADRLDLA